MASVFVSYRRKPSAILAQLIVKDLKEQNIEVYLDIERMEGAGNFPTRLFQAIEVSDVFVCLLGEGTLDSEWVQYEIKHAAELGKPMIPVFQESFEPMALDQVPNPHTKALLEHDGVYIFDLKNVYVPQAVEALARMIENTANWLKQTPAQAEAANMPILSVNIEALAGQKFGQYEIRELLGMGGMSAVYRAHQESLLRDVAIKILPPSIASQQATMDRFLREARTAAALEHAHIVPVYDYGNYGGLSFVVMRLLSGGSLAERLAFAEKEGHSLPSLAEAAAVLKDLSGALDYAHSRGVIHRDIKANNIMFDDQGNPFIVDFGIAKLTNAQNALTGTGVAMGTPLYMSPEQWRGESVTPAADQYALGVTAYAMLTGHLPFEAPTPYALMHKHLNEQPAPPQTWRADLPEAVRDVLNQAMAKNPRNRFPSAKDFADAFENAVNESGIEEEATSFFTEQLPDKPQTTMSPLLGGTPLPDTASKPGFTPPPAPALSKITGEALRVPTPQPDTPASVYSTPPELRPPTPLMPMQPAVGAPTPMEDSLPLTDPTATMMSGHTPAPASVPDQPTPLLTPIPAPEDHTPALDQAQAVSAIPAPENVVAPPPGYVQQITPSGVPIFVPQQIAEEPTASFPNTALMPAARPARSNTPAWLLAAVVVIVLGLLGVVGLILNSQNQQAVFQATQAALLAAIVESSATLTPTSTFTLTPTPTLTATATASPTPATPVVQAISEVVARVGPGPDYPEVATLVADGQLDLVGLSEDGAWYQVVLPDGTRGWIVSSQSLVNVFGDLDLLEIVPAPTNTPSATPSATRTPTDAPTDTRTPTFTLSPTQRPSRTPNPSPTRTPVPRTPTVEPTLTRTPRPSATPSPRPTRTTGQNTPRPTATRTP